MIYNSLLPVPGLFYLGPLSASRDCRSSSPHPSGCLPQCHRPLYTPCRITTGHRVPTSRGSFPHWKPVPRGWELPKLPLLIGRGASAGSRALRTGALRGFFRNGLFLGGQLRDQPPACSTSSICLPQTATPCEAGEDWKSPPKSGSVPKPGAWILGPSLGRAVAGLP